MRRVVKITFLVEASDNGWFFVSEHKSKRRAFASRERFLRRWTDFRSPSIRVVKVVQITTVERLDTGRRAKPRTRARGKRT